MLVLDLLSGADLALDGVLWALAAMLGAATYFVMSADTRSGVPPLALAGGGLAVGTVSLGVLGIVGVLPMHATTAAPTYAGEAVPWWLPFVALGVVTAAIAYTTGIAASRRLGSRLASFVALLEVVAAVIFAWLLLDQLPGALQLVGGAFIVAGVVVVKLGERPPRADVAAARPAHEAYRWDRETKERGPVATRKGTRGATQAGAEARLRTPVDTGSLVVRQMTAEERGEAPNRLRRPRNGSPVARASAAEAGTRAR